MPEHPAPDHHDAEQQMRELVREAGLPEPDEARYGFDPDEVVLLWHERKLAVAVDLEDEPPG